MISEEKPAQTIDMDGHQSEPEYDEFGRIVPRTKKQEIPKKSEWPPCFCERHSVDYVLDVQSGMFFHAGCEFFYDPKSKLYYGNKQQSYFRHVENSTCQYVPVTGEGGISAPQASVQPEAILDPKLGSTSASGATAAISIHLKTKKLPTKKVQHIKHSQASSDSKNMNVHSDRATPLTKPMAKQDSQNIDKWQERRQELTTENCVPKIAATKSGDPVCLLCKRKFKSLEQLQRHEQLSQMHKENLLRFKSTEPPVLAYMDRAQHRRELHQNTTTDLLVAASDLQTGFSAIEASEQIKSMVSVSEQVPTNFDPLGEQNVGRKLLQEMGWKERAHNESSTASGLVKEWDRIEYTMSRGQRLK